MTTVNISPPVIHRPDGRPYADDDVITLKVRDLRAIVVDTGSEIGEKVMEAAEKACRQAVAATVPGKASASDAELLAAIYGLRDAIAAPRVQVRDVVRDGAGQISRVVSREVLDVGSAP